MSFDISFKPKGPEAIQQRVAELKSRLGIENPGEFQSALNQAEGMPSPIQGNIGSGPIDLRGETPPFDPTSTGGMPRKVEIDLLIDRVAREQGVDAKLIHAVVQAESSYNPYDISDTGAKGLMQLMPETAKEVGVRNPFDAYENLTGGTKYLKKMIDRYPGRLDLALAAYNAGPGYVDKAKGIPEFAETQRYVPKVLKQYNGQ
jgi:hypothetical protein